MKNKQIVFDKEYIYTFSKQINPLYVDNIFEYICNILDNSLGALNSKMPIFSDYYYTVTNECKNYAETQNSSIDIFMILKSPQLELSCSYQETKQTKKRKRRKNKKNKNEEEVVKNNIEKYTFKDFKINLLNELVKYFSKNTTITMHKLGYTIIGYEEIGLKVNIYPVFANGENYKIFNTYSYKLTDINFGQRQENIDKKNNKTNGYFVMMLRIFNGLYSNIIGESLNQILIESILYNIPSNMYTGDLYEMFIKIFNFININSLQNIKSITNENLDISKDKLITTNYYNFGKFLKTIAKYL